MVDGHRQASRLPQVTAVLSPCRRCYWRAEEHKLGHACIWEIVFARRWGNAIAPRASPFTHPAGRPTRGWVGKDMRVGGWVAGMPLCT